MNRYIQTGKEITKEEQEIIDDDDYEGRYKAWESEFNNQSGGNYS